MGRECSFTAKTIHREGIKLLKCKISQYEDGMYGWRTRGGSNTCKCIMAVKLGGTVMQFDLDILLKRGIINEREHNAIRMMDTKKATDKHIETVINLAGRLGVELEIRSSTRLDDLFTP